MRIMDFRSSGYIPNTSRRKAGTIGEIIPGRGNSGQILFATPQRDVSLLKFTPQDFSMFDQTDRKIVILSRIQGEIFEESVDGGFDSLEFINSFMNSKTAWHLDLPRHKASWCGKGYVIDEFFRDANVSSGKTWNRNLMFWIGYVYRYWHYYTGQYSWEIYEVAKPCVMRELYPRLCGMPARESVHMLYNAL